MVNCKINDIFIGEVSTVQNYGAFVKIPGTPQQGLIHRTQVSKSHVSDVTEVLSRGDKVWCKIIAINDDGKIGLSMKYVNQGSGNDLDPNMVELKVEEQRRKSGTAERRDQPIKLEAVFNTVCTKCKTPGHLAKDCFFIPGGKVYDLVPDEDEELEDTQIKSKLEDTEKEKPKKEKKHKTKKYKKRKKSKSKRKHSFCSESSDESSNQKKKKKEHNKKKKRKYSSSSDCSSSSDDTRKNSNKNKKNFTESKRPKV